MEAIDVSQSTQAWFVSHSERRNARFQRSMEDTHMIIPLLDGKENVFFAGVYDGHGGKETAEYVRDHLHENLIIAMNSPDLNSMEKQLEYAFYMTDIESKNADVKNSGSTCVCIVLRNEGDKRVLYSANAGDSRSVLYSSGRTQRLSKDHKATDPSEEARINSIGGVIIRGRVLGLLAISRSFGDHSCKRYVIVDPYISKVELTGEEEFVVLACDGVFDVLSDEEVTQIVKEEIEKGNTEGCAERLVQEAVDRHSRDNITAIVIGIKK